MTIDIVFILKISERLAKTVERGHNDLSVERFTIAFL